MKWYLASYPSHCYLTLSKTKFQQFFLYALCRGYLKNPSGKYKIISGEKCVIFLHEDSAGAESAIQWEEFNVAVCSVWWCWCGWTGAHFGSNSSGTCHGHIPCARTPCLHCVCLIPLLLQRYSKGRFSHVHHVSSLVLCTVLPQKSEGFVYNLAAKEKVVWD